MDALEAPRLLERDRIWKKGLKRLQLEIIVGNQTVANIANGTARVSNQFDKP